LRTRDLFSVRLPAGKHNPGGVSAIPKSGHGFSRIHANQALGEMQRSFASEGRQGCEGRNTRADRSVRATRLAKLKSPEVMLNLFVSASSSLLDPCRPLSQRFLAVALARSDARAPGLPPTGQTCPTPRDSILPSTYLPVLLDQHFAIDPC
jgi:hypothetical protein